MQQGARQPLTRRSSAPASMSILAAGATFVALAVGCGSASSRTRVAADLPLAIAASESLTTALADSLSPSGYVNTAADTGRYSRPALNACEDHVDASGWQVYSSDVVDIPLPPDYVNVSSRGSSVRWRGSNGDYVTATVSSGKWTGLITSSCDIYISGSAGRLHVLKTLYGHGVHATINLQGQTIEIDGQARTVERQAELLHALRYARISSSVRSTQ